MDESICDSGSDGGVVEDISPLCEDQIAGDDGRLLLMPGTDNLKEEVGALGAKGKIADLVDDQKIRRLIIMELFE